jgi:hypothetical protein
MFGRYCRLICSFFGDPDAFVRRHDAEAEDARDDALAAIDHANLAFRQIIHLRLAVFDAVGRGENDFLVCAWIVLHRIPTGATAKKKEGEH